MLAINEEKARGLWVGACKNRTDFGVFLVRGNKIIIKLGFVLEVSKSVASDGIK